jgi:hypothetical protein
VFSRGEIKLEALGEHKVDTSFCPCGITYLL